MGFNLSQREFRCDRLKKLLFPSWSFCSGTMVPVKTSHRWRTSSQQRKHPATNLASIRAPEVSCNGLLLTISTNFLAVSQSGVPYSALIRQLSIRRCHCGSQLTTTFNPWPCVHLLGGKSNNNFGALLISATPQMDFRRWKAVHGCVSLRAIRSQRLCQLKVIHLSVRAQYSY
jgi:hypothetical protein